MTGREEDEDEADQGTTPGNGEEAVHHINRTHRMEKAVSNTP